MKQQRQSGQSAGSQKAQNNGKPTTSASSTTEAKPTTDDIRRRAYEIYLERQHAGRPGSSASDWQQAEQELRLSRSAR